MQRDQVAGYDAARETWSLARSEALGWSVLRHEDALTVLRDHENFSSRVSTHAAVPNGMDAPEHAAYRAIVDRCFAPAHVRPFEPELRSIVRDLLATAPHSDVIEVMSAIGEPFGARAQCGYLGWPLETAAALQEWAAGSSQATASGDRTELPRVAERFDRIIVAMLDRQRAAGPDDRDTLTARLLDERIDGAPLSDATLVSMLRNWTAGELGTIAAAVGIIVAHLARDQELQRELRASPDLRPAAMDEILRLEAPLISNRRRTTRQVTLQGRTVPADAPVTILWPAVQHDPRAFHDPTSYQSDRDPAANLLYGRGPHACPGEGLARLELTVLLDELFRTLSGFTLAPGEEPVRATYPNGGFAEVRIVPTPRGPGSFGTRRWRRRPAATVDRPPRDPIAP